MTLMSRLRRVRSEKSRPAKAVAVETPKPQSPTPGIKLTYFDFRGRGEPARLAFVLGGVSFTDDRIPFSAWKKLKADTPYGSVPTITVNGKLAAQSKAVLRYAGKKANLYPSNATTALYVDEVVDSMSELRDCVYRYSGKDKKALMMDREKLVKEDIPRLVAVTETRLADFGEGPYAVGGRLSIADLIIANLVNCARMGLWEHVPLDVFAKYPNIMASHDVVMNHPKVIDFYKKHPIKK